MDLSTITIDPEIAKARVKEYEELLVEERTREDAAIAAGYRAAARGLPIIQLSKCFSAAGVFEGTGLPRLAVARATAKRVICVRGSENLVFHSDVENLWGGPQVRGNPTSRTALVGSHHVRVPHVRETYFSPPRRAVTIVPNVPPRFRPKRRNLSSYHVLWEVEDWTMIPPVDPALIKHIRGDLWTVLATWDLTELERAVLAERA